MKNLILAAALLVSASVHADARQGKVFQASYCSAFDRSALAKDELAATQVCLGKWLTKSQKDAVQIFVNDNTVRVYTIKMDKYPARMGANPYNFAGKVVKPAGSIDDIQGVYTYTTGMTVSREISLDTESGIHFSGAIGAVVSKR